MPIEIKVGQIYRKPRNSKVRSVDPQCYNLRAKVLEILPDTSLYIKMYNINNPKIYRTDIWSLEYLLEDSELEIITNAN